MNETSPPSSALPVLSRGQVFGQRGRDHPFGELRVMERWYAPQSQIPAHSHAQANLCLVVRGGFHETFSGRGRQCGPATLLYRPPAEVHAQTFRADGSWCITIEPPGDWLPTDGTGPDGAVDLSGLPTLAAMRLHIALRRHPWSNARRAQALARDLCSASARRLVLSRRPMPDWVREAHRLLHTGLTGSIRLADVAAAVGVHRVHLARFFRRAYGCRAVDYVRHLRVNAACRAILSRCDSLSRIAVDLGFSDHSHLTRAFRATLGLTPSAFRDLMTSEKPAWRAAVISNAGVQPNQRLKLPARVD